MARKKKQFSKSGQSAIMRLKSYQFRRLSMIVSFINVKRDLSMSFFREYLTLKRGIPIV